MKTLALLMASSCVVGWCPWMSAQEVPHQFAAGAALDVGRGSGQLIAADVNHDGHLDLLAQHLLQRRLSVLLGSGRGEFQAAPALEFEFQPSAMDIGDVDQDGNLDLAIASRTEEHEFVHILRGNGKGEFEEGSGSPLTISATVPRYKPSVHLVDLNGDGKLDLITANGRRATVEVLLGNGSGEFTLESVVSLEAGHDFYTYTVADVNADERLDLVAAGSTPELPSSRVLVRISDASAFDRQLPAVSVPSSARVAAVADVNGDQFAEIVLSHDIKAVSVLMNESGEKFAGAAAPIALDEPAYFVEVADVNGDGHSDLIVPTVSTHAPEFTSKILVFLGSQGRISPAPAGAFAAGPGAYRVVAADLNHDSNVDIVASSFEGDALTLLLSR